MPITTTATTMITSALRCFGAGIGVCTRGIAGIDSCAYSIEIFGIDSKAGIADCEKLLVGGCDGRTAGAEGGGGNGTPLC